MASLVIATLIMAGSCGASSSGPWLVAGQAVARHARDPHRQPDGGQARADVRPLLRRRESGFVASITLIGYVLYFWLCWDKNRQEIWDKMCNTVVVNDRDNLLDLRHEQIPAAMPPVPLS